MSRKFRPGESVPTIYGLCRSAEETTSSIHRLMLGKAIKRGHRLYCLKVRKGRIWMSTSAPIPTSPHRVRRPAAPARAQESAPPTIRCGAGHRQSLHDTRRQRPFPTELTDEVGGGLQERGKEFGATTGRARRCGWFDGVVVRHATRVNGLTSLAVTKLDVLDGCKELKFCTGYRYEGKLYRDMPADLDMFIGCQPVYEKMRGWTTSTTGRPRLRTLPREAKRYLKRIEELAECRIDMISTGSKRQETIILRNPLKSPSKRKPTRKGQRHPSDECTLRQRYRQVLLHPSR